jgi:regulator of protease activity HflC (stomatin/prohibitin superfamily)
MRILHRAEVFPNTKGLLFKNNTFDSIVEPGIYQWYFVDPRAYRVVRLDSKPRTVTLPNQEIATKDQIALRVSFFVQYHISDYEKAFSLIDTSSFDRIASVMVMHAIDMAVFQKTLVEMVAKVSGMDSSAVFDALSSLEATKDELARINASLPGIEVTEVRVKNISYPKRIQEILAERLAAKIKAQTELENARTTVAAARTLANASTLMRENEGIQHLLYLNTIKEIAQKGKHTFVVGDVGSENSKRSSTK